MKNQKTVEQQVADVILQEPKNFKIGNKTYTVAPPSIATIIKVSAFVSKLPEIDIKVEPSKLYEEALRVARDCDVMGDILATLILGAKYTSRFPIWNKYNKLRKSVLKDITPTQYAEILGRCLQGGELVPFLVTSGSLSGANILKPTKNNDQIPFGPQ